MLKTDTYHYLAYNIKHLIYIYIHIERQIERERETERKKENVLFYLFSSNKKQSISIGCQKSIILPLLLIPSWALAIDPFLIPCFFCLLAQRFCVKGGVWLIFGGLHCGKGRVQLARSRGLDKQKQLCSKNITNIVSMYVYSCIYIYMYVCTYIYIYAYNMNVNIYIYIHVKLIHICIYMYIYIHICYVYTYVYRYI